MMQRALLSFSLLIIFLHSTKTLAQGPAAAPAQVPPAAPVKPSPTTPSSQAPAALVQPTSGPLDIPNILQNASHFTVFVRLLQATKEDLELNKELNTTKNGMTIFAPRDNAFSSLKGGFLNSLTDGNKIELVKFHVIPGFIPASQFQTVSNPVRTQAGTGNRVSLNVTTTGNFVNITTGLTNATITDTVYTNDRLGIYEVDKVLLPLDLFTAKPPAPAPAAVVDKPKRAPGTAAAESPTLPKDDSGAVSFIVNNNVVFLAAGIVAAMLS